MEHLHGGRVDRIAAKIAQEILVLFDNDHIDTLPGEQIAQHDAGRPAASDTAFRFNYLHVPSP